MHTTPPEAVVMSSDIGPVIGILVGALVAALGYVGKLVVEAIKEWRTERELRLARLHRLQALLRASWAAFLVQRDQADRLAQRLHSRFPDELPGTPGFERLFAHFHDRFDDDETDLHRVIRAYTEHALRPLNETMLTWLREDVVHRTTHGKTGSEALLAERLNQLDGHLLLWLAKYQAWIPNRPDHALVYLADEEEHGLGFPSGIEDALEAVLSERG